MTKQPICQVLKVIVPNFFMVDQSQESQPQRRLLFFQTAAFRNAIFVLMIIVAEAILAIRYGADTYHYAYLEHKMKWPDAGSTVWIALAGFDVLLIDFVFILLISVAKFAGQSDKASKLRTIAILGGAAMFVAMIFVATGNFPVVYAARMAGIMLLLFVGGDVLVDQWKRFNQWLRNKRTGKPAKPLTERLFAANLNVGYIIALIATAPIAWLVGIFSVFVDYGKFAKQKVGSKRVIIGKATPLELPEQAYELDDIADKILAIWKIDPYASNPEVGRQVGITGEAVRQRRKRLEAAKVIHSNGNGVKIVEERQRGN